MLLGSRGDNLERMPVPPRPHLHSLAFTGLSSRVRFFSGV